MQERAVTEMEALQSEGHIYIASFLQRCRGEAAPTASAWTEKGLQHQSPTAALPRSLCPVLYNIF